MVVYLDENYQLKDKYGVALQESTDPEIKELLKSWRPSGDGYGFHRETFKSSAVTDEEYVKFKELFKTLRTEKDYKTYKRAFDTLCKYCHIDPKGTIITRYQITKGKEDDENTIIVKYTFNTKPIHLPEGVTLYHNSPIDGIKELNPNFRLRGRNENGYLCDKPRVYLTLAKKISTIHTDNDFIKKLDPRADSEFGNKMHLYKVKNLPTNVYVDPMIQDTVSKCCYVETDTPLAVEQIK